MLIVDENNNPIIIDNIHGPVLTNYFYVLDLNMRDYTLSPLQILEESCCPSLTLQIHGFEFILPANWNVLVYSEDTHQLDVIEVSALAGAEFTALVYGNQMSFIKPGIISVVDYSPNHKNISPSLHKHQMLCHPISETTWINISPSDSYAKYIKDTFVGDIIS